GASRGFGAAAARLIASRGNIVVATMCNPDRDAAAVTAGFEERIHPFALDVTDRDGIHATVAAVLERFGHIDALINNAGYGLYGPIEDASEEEAWRELNTNVLGQWRVAQAILPHFRARCRGKVVNVSSTAGRMAGPMTGMYAASKHCVEAMSESLRFELVNTGVQVCIVEPGMFASDWQTTNLDVCAAVREGTSVYKDVVAQQLESFRELAKTRPGSASVAAAMADIVELKQRLPLRWPVGNDATHMLPLRAMVTDEVWDYLRRSGALGYWRAPIDNAHAQPPANAWSYGTGQVVLMTGASRGFGEAAAREIASRGNTVIATMRNPDRDAAKVVEGFEDSIHPVALDVTDAPQAAAVVADVIARYGRIDALINNAGYGLYGPFEDLSEAEVHRQLNTNFLGQWRMMKAVLPQMRVQGHGKIVNVSSLSGQVPSPLMAFYAGSKHAVEAMSEAAADEVRRWGIQVTIMEPGMYRSDWQTTNLDVCERFRSGQSPYQRAMEKSLEGFRRLAITRPGSDAVAAAMADAVQLQQPLPLRWPIGNDCVSLLRQRRALTDEQWEQQMLAAGWGFARDDVESGSLAAQV
ncbi:hypothetical protein AYO38_10845, partial [bacterium SCGC AG-212-C10]